MAKKTTIGAGALFPATAKSIFMQVTGERYDNMLARVKKKGFFGLPFDKEQFRAAVLAAMGGMYDGYLRCQYCTGYYTIEQVAVDHAIPLARGGGVEMDNLELPCKRCNSQKGKMLPEEFLDLLAFLNTKIPLAKTDVLERLEKAVPLARGFSHNARIIKDLRAKQSEPF